MRTLLYCLLLTATCSLFPSCGQVGEPLPPMLKIPARVEGLQARQFEDRALIGWAPVVLTTEGAALEDLDRVALYAVEIARDAPPASAEALAPYFQVLAAVEGDKNEIEIPVHDRFGQRTALAAQAFSTKGKASPWSEVLVLDLTAPPAAPSGLRAEPAPHGVALSWDAVDGAAGYLVERASGDGEFQPAGESEQPELADASAQFETEYVYRVRGRAAAETGAVPGPPSEAVAITPTDIFPPAAPVGLRAIRTPESIELSWSASQESDLAGYRVERDGEPLHEGILTAPAFSESPAPAGPGRYEVVAVDRKGNASNAGVLTVE